MKLLFDQNLSRKLIPPLADIFPDASHVQFEGMTIATDTEIWEFAKAKNFCIVTQDADFAEKSSLYGSPAKVICLRSGTLKQKKLNQSYVLGQQQYKNCVLTHC